MVLVEKLRDSRPQFYESPGILPLFGGIWTRDNKETVEQAFSLIAIQGFISALKISLKFIINNARSAPILLAAQSETDQ